MGVAAKHNYRFGFLQSEFWKTMRLRVISEHYGFCAACGTKWGANLDVHHLFYPKNPYDIKACELWALCRRCHDAIHEFCNPGKNKNICEGKAMYYAALTLARAKYKIGKNKGAPRRKFSDHTDFEAAFPKPKTIYSDFKRWRLEQETDNQLGLGFSERQRKLSKRLKNTPEPVLVPVAPTTPAQWPPLSGLLALFRGERRITPEMECVPH